MWLATGIVICGVGEVIGGKRARRHSRQSAALAATRTFPRNGQATRRRSCLHGEGAGLKDGIRVVPFDGQKGRRGREATDLQLAGYLSA